MCNIIIITHSLYIVKKKISLGMLVLFCLVGFFFSVFFKHIVYTNKSTNDGKFEGKKNMYESRFQIRYL